MRFLRYANGQTDKHTGRQSLITILRTLIGGEVLEVINNSTNVRLSVQASSA